MKPGHCLVPLPIQTSPCLAAIPISQGPLRDWHTSNLNPSPRCYPEPNLNVVIAVRAGPNPTIQICLLITPSLSALLYYQFLPLSHVQLCLGVFKAGGSMRLGYDMPRQGDPDPLAYLQ